MQKPTRTMWIAAILVSVVCVAALAYGLITSWNVAPERTPPPAAHSAAGGRFGFGLVVGLGAGIVIGSLIARRTKRD